jgi:hypothetical protein
VLYEKESWVVAWAIIEGLKGFNNSLKINNVRVATLKMSVLFEQGLKRIDYRQGWLIVASPP